MAEEEPPASPVLALREAFGDRKLPDISRKITACVACRKQKIKCQMADGRPPCTRCKKRGLSCAVNRSLQMLLESDTSWKHAMEKKMRRLEAIVAMVAKDKLSPNALRQIQDQPADHQGLDPLDQQSKEVPLETETETDKHEHQQELHHNGDQGANHWEIVMDLDSGPGAMPGFYISDTPQSSTETGHSSRNSSHHSNHMDSHSTTNSNNNTVNSRSGDSDQDFIARDIVSLERAQTYFDNYRSRMDHFPYRILCDHGPVSLAGLRATSPLLVAAVCCVGALHTRDCADGADDFDRLHAEFVSLCAGKAMTKACTMDDVRALCIGAFWLGGDLSWSLVGAAVRMATELQLHRSFSRALQESSSTSASGDRRLHYQRTRLWYLVYVCDHHFSVVYGRPPLTREDESVRGARRFLAGPHATATEDDARLVSQVLRWSLCSDIFDTFGADVARPLADAEVPHLRRFGLALDGLRAEWADRFRPNPHVGNYPRKGVLLQYNFAKLYLCSHAFRGLPRGEGGQGHVGSRHQPLREAARMIIDGNGETRSTPATTDTTTTTTTTSSSDAAMDLDEAANTGVLAALAILRAVVSDTEIQSYLDGLPVYFDVMIAFAAVFLLKVAAKFSASVLINVHEITSLVVKLVATLKRITQTMHPRHLLVSITRGIDGLLRRSGLAAVHEKPLQTAAATGGARTPSTGPAAAEAAAVSMPEAEQEPESTITVQAAHDAEATQAVRAAQDATAHLLPGHEDHIVTESDNMFTEWGTTHEQLDPDPYFMGEYDLLMNQDMDFDMQFSADL